MSKNKAGEAIDELTYFLMSGHTLSDYFHGIGRSTKEDDDYGRAQMVQDQAFDAEWGRDEED